MASVLVDVAYIMHFVSTKTIHIFHCVAINLCPKCGSVRQKCQCDKTLALKGYDLVVEFTSFCHLVAVVNLPQVRHAYL